MKQAEERGDLVLAEELTAFAIGSNAETNYNITLVGASHTCFQCSTIQH